MPCQHAHADACWTGVTLQKGHPVPLHNVLCGLDMLLLRLSLPTKKTCGAKSGSTGCMSLQVPSTIMQAKQ